MKKAVKKKNKTNLIIPIFVAALILLLAILLIKQPILLAPGELSVERDLPESAQINQQFIVTLQVYTSTDKPAAIGITEQVPASWIISSVSGADYSKINTDSLEILLFSSTNNVDDTTITYTITPTNTLASFSGTWESVDPDSSGNIAGDTSLTINTDSEGGGEIGGGSGGGSYTPPRTNQTQVCQENWFCSTWNECENEKQTRTCTDTNLCGTTNLKPVEQASCETTQAQESEETKSIFIPILILLIAAITIVIIFIIIRRKKRRDKK